MATLARGVAQITIDSTGRYSIPLRLNTPSQFDRCVIECIVRDDGVSSAPTMTVQVSPYEDANTATAAEWFDLDDGTTTVLTADQTIAIQTAAPRVAINVTGGTFNSSSITVFAWASVA